MSPTSSSSQPSAFSSLRNGSLPQEMGSHIQSSAHSVSLAENETLSRVIADTCNAALFYAGYAAILTPAFGISAAYADNLTELNNGLGFWVLREYIAKRSLLLHIEKFSDSALRFAVWTIFVLTFLIASLPTNVVYILIFTFVDIAFLLIAASYFALADGHDSSATGLKKAGGVFCFLAGLVGWYVLEAI
jgi:succinate-acetate transporter protein